MSVNIHFQLKLPSPPFLKSLFSSIFASIIYIMPAKRGSSVKRSKNQKENPPPLEVACDFSSGMKDMKWTNSVAVFLWFGWFATLPLLAFALIPSWMYYRPLFWIIIGVVTFFTIVPIDLSLQPQWCYDIGSWAMRANRYYFGFKVCFRNKKLIENSGPAVFCIEPHDVLPLALFSLSDCLTIIKGHKMIGCVTSAIFRVPFIRQIFTWGMSVSADKNKIRDLMRNNYSITVCPGGVQEVTLMEPGKNECVLYLKERKGLIKLAMEFGRPVVPMFSFGQRKSYDFWVPKDNLAIWLGRKLGFLPMIFFGSYGIPLGVPKSIPLTVVVGDPIPIPKFDVITKEDVEKYHNIFLNAMIDIYEKHKVQFDMGETELRIV
jgi:diacylglycerol O-acyltransferase 2, plant